MNKETHLPSTIFAQPVPGLAMLNIQTFSYDERRVAFSEIDHALYTCGCWMLDRRALSFTQTEFRFEVQLRAIVDLYAALIAAGLELSRASHEELTIMCTVRKHNDFPAGQQGVITVRLEVNFVEEGSEYPALSSGNTQS